MFLYLLKLSKPVSTTMYILTPSANVIVSLKVNLSFKISNLKIWSFFVISLNLHTDELKSCSSSPWRKSSTNWQVQALNFEAVNTQERTGLWTKPNRQFRSHHFHQIDNYSTWNLKGSNSIDIFTLWVSFDTFCYLKGWKLITDSLIN